MSPNYTHHERIIAICTALCWLFKHLSRSCNLNQLSFPSLQAMHSLRVLQWNSHTLSKRIKSVHRCDASSRHCTVQTQTQYTAADLNFLPTITPQRTSSPHHRSIISFRKHSTKRTTAWSLRATPRRLLRGPLQEECTISQKALPTKRLFPYSS